MLKDRTVHDTTVVPHTRAVPGLILRSFRGEVDYAAMVAVSDGSKAADGIERTESVEEVARNYQHLTNCDPYRDMLFAELNGEVIGYSRVWWVDDLEGNHIYAHLAFVLPQWREKGIRQTLLRFNERRLREIAAGHSRNGPRLFEAWASDSESHWASILSGHGYEAVRHGYSMVRPTLEDIPVASLPDGVEARPALPEHYRIIWEAAREAFRDEWMYSEDEWTDEQFEAWQRESIFNPSLWQIAWDGDQVVGMVLNFIDKAENEEYNRKRGYTEAICVRRPWRRRGVARALIARSFCTLKERGMAEAALGVDAQNPSGALQLYESMGFRPVKCHTVYRKSMD